MAFGTFLSPHQAAGAVLTLYEAFGVGNQVSTMHHLDQIQHLVQQAVHDKEDLGARLLALPPHWLATAALGACERLLWAPGHPFKAAVTGWTALLAKENPVAAFYAIILALVEQCKASCTHTGLMQVVVMDGVQAGEVAALFVQANLQVAQLIAGDSFNYWYGKIGALEWNPGNLDIVRGLVA